MSKLYNTYKYLKSNNSNTVYLFRAGIFYLLLDDDAKLLSNKLGLKLSNLNDSILKCAFPASHMSKYSELLKYHNIDFDVVDESSNLTTSNKHLDDVNLSKFIEKFNKTDIDYLSISKAYDLLYEFKNIVNKIK